MSSVTTTRAPLSEMKELRRMRAHARELGWSFSLWDTSCQIVESRDEGNDFCRSVIQNGGHCRSDDEAIARQVLAEGKPAVGQGPCGCCKLGLPIYQRRRLLGAVVTGYPTRTMAEEPNLRKLAAAKNLDFEHVRTISAGACRYSEKDAQHFLKILQWMLEQETTVETSHKEIAKLSDNLANTYEELNLVYRISGAMKVTQQPTEFLRNICNELVEVMNIGAVLAIAYAYPSTSEEDQVVVAGDVDLNPEQIKLFCATQVAADLAGGNKTVVENSFRAPGASGLGNSIRNFVAAPLASDEQSIGVLVGINKPGDFDSVDMKLLSSIANQSSVFLANHRLYADLQDLLMGVLHALTATIDAKDPYTCGHSQRVALISRKLAEMCGFSEQKIQQVYLMGLLHDIGKIGVPEAVLCKPGRLTDEEFESIKKHPAVGAKILGGIRQLDDVVSGILTHHERPDGRGYPRKLKGNEVPFEGLIVGLSDCFDAMTSSRTYRAALPLATVTAEIRKYAGAQFDQQLVDKLLSLDLEKFLSELHAPIKTVLPVAQESIEASTEPETAAPADGGGEGGQ